MITSNIDEILLKNHIDSGFNKSVNSEAFINTLIDTKQDEVTSRTAAFTYENIKGISLEEIDELFVTNEDKETAKNLRIATMFTEDKNLGQALFNTVLGQPFDLGYSYLYDTYEDKHSFLEYSSNSNKSLSDILHTYVSQKVNLNQTTNKTEVIPQEYLDEILLEVNSFSFLSAMESNSKDQYGRYKDEDDDYSFLYNDYALKYQELLYKYEDLQSYEKSLIGQY